MIYVVFIVFAVIVIFIININNTKSKEDANKQYFSESIKSYENFNPTYHYCPVKAGKSVFEIVET